MLAQLYPPALLFLSRHTLDETVGLASDQTGRGCVHHRDQQHGILFVN